MAKNGLKEQLEVFETYINDIPFVIDPCRMCEKTDKDGNRTAGNLELCKQCCWFYDSQFELRKTDGQGEAGDED